MEVIVSQAGFLMSCALDTIGHEQVLYPFYETTSTTGSKNIKEFRENSLEQSIPKAIDAHRANSSNALSGIVVYPAELEENGKRTPLVVAMLKDYEQQIHIVIAQYYSIENNQLQATQYEILDASPSVVDKLQSLEKYFLQGALSYSAKISADITV